MVYNVRVVTRPACTMYGWSLDLRGDILHVKDHEKLCCTLDYITFAVLAVCSAAIAGKAG